MLETDISTPAPALSRAPAPLIVHLIHRLDVGGLENGLVNLINHMPPERYRHAIICLTEAGDFRRRIQRSDVQIISLNKREGKDLLHYFRLYRTIRQLRPQLLHTRNLAGMEAHVLAALAGVRLRVHGEHGRDMADLYGNNKRYRLLRQLLRPLISHFIAVSKDLQAWLLASIGATPARVSYIRNGVDSVQFHPRLGPRAVVGPPGFLCDDAFVIGSVGRMAEVKDHVTLVRAFLLLAGGENGRHTRLRLMIIGAGPCHQQCLDLLHDAGAAHLAWLPGARTDIPQLMRTMDVFVLPSLAEGMSNTILEAMATGLPVVATTVGGNLDLVHGGWTGSLVPPRVPELMADAIADYFRIPGLAAMHGARARRQVMNEYSMMAMTEAYLAVYDALTTPSTAQR
jgi:sugar transferase (PEP-CTERM/EpsH1 system associated)